MINVESATLPQNRRPMMESLGCHIKGAALPHPCATDQNTMIAGVCKRIAAKVPRADKDELHNIKRFVFSWLKQNLEPLSSTTKYDFEDWLGRTNYPEWRKQDLRVTYASIVNPRDKRNFFVKCFMKDETYTEYKHARGIFSRKDEAKCLLGPFIKKIEEVLYTHPAFIKHIPVRERPDYISRLLDKPGAKYIATDYTSFESHFTAEVMENIEFVLYRYMLKECPDRGLFEFLLGQLSGTNKCTFKRFKLDINATRMSGEMCTSLGNGFANYMLMLYTCKKIGSECTGVVEGDDGLFIVHPRIPTPEDFAEIGFTIKMEVHENLRTASFCGIIFDEKDKVNVTDPLEVLCGFGWSKNTYIGARRVRKMELLRSKSLSFLHQYPGCPIIQSLAKYGLRVTKHIDLRRYLERERNISMWEREQLLAALEDLKDGSLIEKPVPANTRLLVEELYGIPVRDQKVIENYLDEKQELSPLDCPSILRFMKWQWRHYFSEYVMNSMGDYPILSVKPYKNELVKYSDVIRLSDSLKRSGLSGTVLQRREVEQRKIKVRKHR